ncbi:PEP/pyruvate-binding domain-containing protein [Alicyclobacillus tolerans]|uniref:Phosphoenolpyruvate synthase n=1 Tax=Alicyclobacillus tolerans TaxID=90970 RepID=A0ABT9LYU2_9BACL|nr:PEP/pyruvate-binding domain-containing protein [Alicyclobacillus tengchongensis]MDP9729443.1 pyruvate,water dikinase [Alicyclobacillus tengchongensis]
MEWVVSLTEAADQLGKEGCGSKAFELSRLMQRGYCVPDGFVVAGKVHESITSAEAESKAADMQVAMLQAFNRLMERYGAVSVRSSCTVEDLSHASFAGQYETVLNIRNQEAFFQALRHCWNSISYARVNAYAKANHISLHGSQMPLIIQGMVNADTSGVAFSIHPVTHENSVIVNVSYGLGEAIVSGLVTPDTFLYEKTTGKLHAEIGSKELKCVLQDQGVCEIDTTWLEQQRLCITEEKVLEVCKLTENLEKEYQTPVDVEFSFQEGQLYLLQVRPITTTKEKTAV